MSKIRYSSPLSGSKSAQAVIANRGPFKKDETNLLKKVLNEQAMASGLRKNDFNWQILSQDEQKSTWFSLIRNYNNVQNKEVFRKITMILKKYKIDELNENNHPINWKNDDNKTALDLSESQDESDLYKLLLHYDRMACLQNLIGQQPEYDFTKFQDNLDKEEDNKELALEDLEALLSRIKEVFETEKSTKNIINKLIEFFYSSKITESGTIEDCDGFSQEEVEILEILSLNEDDDFYENPVKIAQNKFIYAMVLHWIENEKNEIQSCETSPSASPRDSDAENLNEELNEIFK